MPIQNLVPSVPSILQSAARAAQVLVLVDFDGGLVPLESDPAHARLPETVRQWLRRLVDSPRATVGVLSVRSMGDLKERIGIEGIVYVANDGIEIQGRGIHFLEPLAYLMEPAMNRLVFELMVALDGLPNVRVEDKRFTAGVYFANAAEEIRKQAVEAVQQLVRTHWQFESRVNWYGLDVVPRTVCSKASAVCRIRRELRLADSVSIFAGGGSDDDEAIAALAGTMAIRAEGAASGDSMGFVSPAAIWTLLAQLEGVLSAPRAEAPMFAAATAAAGARERFAAHGRWRQAGSR